MNIIKVTKDRLTKDEAAQLLGLKVYDTAIPQTWLDDLYLKMSITPAGRLGQLPEGWKDIILSSLVWCYDGNLFGYPVVLTMKAYNLLNKESILYYVWDFSKQAAILDIPEPPKEETFILEGYESIRHTIIAFSQEEAEKEFHAKYPMAKITAVKIKIGSHISYTKE